jgi:hypothetical protein
LKDGESRFYAEGRRGGFVSERFFEHGDGSGGEPVHFIVEDGLTVAARGIECMDEFGLDAAPMVDGGAMNSGLFCGSGDRMSFEKEFQNPELLRGEGRQR